MRYLTYILIYFVLFSCKSSTNENEQNDSKIVAKAGNDKLNIDEFKEDFVSTGIIKDSSYNAKKSIENWATESLFYQEALSKLNSEEIDVERQVQDYKKALVNYIYQTKLIEANLDTAITKQEIEDYYNAHRDNFILKENIIKVDYLKIPIKAQGLDKIKRLLKSTLPKDKEQLKNLYIQNAENFFMNDSTWLYLEDIKKEIPKLKDQPDFNLSSGKILEFTDEYYFYYLKVRDIKVKNGLSPLNFERQNIKKFIVNKRKTQLINSYKQLLLDKAKKDKVFVTF